jgi:integrase
MGTGKFTDVELNSLKSREKRYLSRSEDGLCLEVMPNSKKYWRYRFWDNGKDRRLPLGEYPLVTLKEARLKRDECKLRRAAGEDLRPKKNDNGATFEAVARDWFKRQVKPVRAEGHSRTVLYRLERFLLPSLGTRPVAEIKTPELLAVIRSIEASGTIETAHRVRQIAGQIFRFGIVSGVCEHDLGSDLRGALTPRKPEHQAALTDPREVEGLVRAMETYRGSPIVRAALWFTAYTFQRQNNIRHAEWAEMDFKVGLWRIPAEKMKGKRDHLVPLSRQCVGLLETLSPLTGHGKYIFPSERTPDGSRGISENTINAALRRMGFGKEEMCAHGFRGMASTVLNEQGWNSDVIELCLAHQEQNQVRAAYNHSERMEDRRELMQSWADYLDWILRLQRATVPVNESHRSGQREPPVPFSESHCSGG